MVTKIDVAAICHEANKTYCESIGDLSQKTWDDAPDWQRDSAINGVEFHIANPDAGTDDSHISWLKEKKSKIEWTEHTWNPFQGCHKISEGCKNCYMFSDKKRYGQDPNVVVQSKSDTFNKPGSWHAKLTGSEPMEERLVFTASWSDWFIEENDPHRPDAWDVIRRTPNLIYQILTKRADRIAECLPEDWGDGWPNVWLGVSVENQARAEERIPLLKQVPAKLRFLSIEPLLELVWIREHLNCESCIDRSVHWCVDPVIDWVIVGGESGAGARRCELGWIESIVKDCAAADVPCFVKQIGAAAYVNPIRIARYKDSKGGNMAEWPLAIQVREMPAESRTKATAELAAAIIESGDELTKEDKPNA